MFKNYNEVQEKDTRITKVSSAKFELIKDDRKERKRKSEEK